MFSSVPPTGQNQLADGDVKPKHDVLLGLQRKEPVALAVAVPPGLLCICPAHGPSSRRCLLAGPGSGHHLDAGSAGLAAHTPSGQRPEAPALFLPPQSCKQLGTRTANFPEQVEDNLALYYGWASVGSGDVHNMAVSIGRNP